MLWWPEVDSSWQEPFYFDVQILWQAQSFANFTAQIRGMEQRVLGKRWSGKQQK